VQKVLEQRPDRPLQLEERALHLAGQLLDLCYADAGIRKSGKEEAPGYSGSTALTKFKQIVQAQGGTRKLPRRRFPSAQKPCGRATHSGTVRAVNNINLNSIAKLLGAPKDRQAACISTKKSETGGKRRTVTHSTPTANTILRKRRTR
jgi:thymidine phosphorylase